MIQGERLVGHILDRWDRLTVHYDDSPLKNVKKTLRMGKDAQLIKRSSLMNPVGAECEGLTFLSSQSVLHLEELGGWDRR